MYLLLIFLQIEQKNEIPKSYERTENFIEDLENKSYHSRLDYSKLQGGGARTTTPLWDFVAKVTILFRKMFYLTDKMCFYGLI